jgi:predicted TIM-barrel fold metal-dependent hydrolase
MNEPCAPNHSANYPPSASARDYPVVDADRHTIEPIELWKRELPERWKGLSPYYDWPDPADFRAAVCRRFSGETAPDLEPVPMLMFDGQPLTRGLSIAAQVELALTVRSRLGTWWSGSTPFGQLAAMDHAGIDIGCFVPTWASYLLAVDESPPDFSTSVARVYNDWLAAYCRTAPRRLVPAGVIPRHDPAAALAELQRVGDLGFPAIVTRPNPIAGRTLGHPDWEPLWRACAERGLAVLLHEGTHARVTTVGADRFSTRFAQHACSHPMEHMLAFASLLEAGVLERHPSLRVGFLEAGAGWVPFWLRRLDYEFEQLRGEVRGCIEARPSDYFKRQCWVSIEGDDPVEQIAREIGIDRLVFGTDYPHVDHALDGMYGILGTLDEAGRRSILSDNPLGLYAPQRWTGM